MTKRKTTTFDYQEYLASREWALLKNSVRQRSGGICERCRTAPYEQTHHKTYARVGHEELDDLLGVCRPCHEFLSAKTDVDPADKPPAWEKITMKPKPLPLAPSSFAGSQAEQVNCAYCGTTGVTIEGAGLEEATAGDAIALHVRCISGHHFNIHFGNIKTAGGHSAFARVEPNGYFFKNRRDCALCASFRQARGH